MEDSDLGKFQTTLRDVLTFIKYSTNEEKPAEILSKEKGFHHMGRNEVNVLNACVGANLNMNKGEEVLDVCLAIQKLEEKAAKKERITTLSNDVKKLMKNMSLTIEQSMDVLEVPKDDRELLSEMLN